jgi:hypothetical protein
MYSSAKRTASGGKKLTNELPEKDARHLVLDSLARAPTQE